ncbi:transcriptional regulator [Ligilactobacillus agilis]|uniref:helix-turn-helix domain-containing protein n=1 Tax=Ligilactobacillus agilis TaxID=1601 RepID=UPI0014379CD9|nr:helix-turn-helix transcriptional regulator [Ligilactobacillus agilis]GET14249.1 transcriptional regulator [Ligilactobacillus agilis]
MNEKSKKNKDIGLRIKKIRKSQNKTLEEFGKLFSPPASKSIVSRWESGKSIPSVERLQKLSQIAKCSIDDILYGTLKENILMLVNAILSYSKYEEDSLENKLVNVGNSTLRISEVDFFIGLFNNDTFERPPEHLRGLINDNRRKEYQEWKKGTLDKNGFSKKGIEYIVNVSEDIAKAKDIKAYEHEELLDIILGEEKRHFEDMRYTNESLRDSVLFGLDDLIDNIDTFVSVYNNKTKEWVQLNNEIDYSYYESIKNFLWETYSEFLSLYGGYEE